MPLAPSLEALSDYGRSRFNLSGCSHGRRQGSGCRAIAPLGWYSPLRKEI
ncbi:MAG: hypothetical protein WA939_16870 [Nodosilinea sp.]